MSSYGPGYAPAAPNENGALLAPRVRLDDRPGVLFAHMFGGNASVVFDPLYGPPAWHMVESEGLLTFAGDFGGINEWGGNGGIARVDDGYGYLVEQGAADAPVGLGSYSMGTHQVLNWAVRNLDKVSAIALMLPTPGLEQTHDDYPSLAYAIELAYGGDRAAINHATNPGAESGLDHWDGDGGVTQIPSVVPGHGFYWVQGGASPGPGDWAVSYEGIPAAAGETWSARMTVDLTGAATDLALRIRFLDGGGGTLSEVTGAAIHPPSVGVAYEIAVQNAVAPANTASLEIRAVAAFTGAGSQIIADNVMAVEETTIGAYGDGGTTGWEWDGDPNDSTSRTPGFPGALAEHDYVNFVAQLDGIPIRIFADVNDPFYIGAGSTPPHYSYILDQCASADMVTFEGGGHTLDGLDPRLPARFLGEHASADPIEHLWLADDLYLSDDLYLTA